VRYGVRARATLRANATASTAFIGKPPAHQPTSLIVAVEKCSQSADEAAEKTV
jgi:hypothetical protein